MTVGGHAMCLKFVSRQMLVGGAFGLSVPADAPGLEHQYLP